MSHLQAGILYMDGSRGIVAHVRAWHLEHGWLVLILDDPPGIKLIPPSVVRGVLLKEAPSLDPDDE